MVPEFGSSLFLILITLGQSNKIFFLNFISNRTAFVLFPILAQMFSLFAVLSFLLPASQMPNPSGFLSCVTIAQERMIETRIPANQRSTFPYRPILIVGTKADLKHNAESIASLSARSLAVMTTEQGNQI